MPTKIGVLACYILTLYLHEFFEHLDSKFAIKFFDDHGLYIVHGQKGKFAIFEGSGISETGSWSRQPKLVYMHVTSTPICMNFLSRFRLIKFFDDHGL